MRLAVDEAACRRGRVLSVHGLTSTVQGDEGEIYHCATRRILKTLSTDQRNPVAVGDRVLLRLVENMRPKEGLIERVEPRHGTLSRAIRGRRQLLVTNVDQLLIVASVAEPPLKPNLIDRLLVAAEKGRVRPVICLNKIDLGDPAALQPLVGVYSRMGYAVLLLSAKTGFGLDRFRRLLGGRESVVAGQSGVGKSSLLNAIEPALGLPIGSVCVETEKGRHTTTTARLLPVAGGFVVDTPGMRQFEPWDVIAEEVAGYFRDLRPYVSLCRFPDCTHTHEQACAVKDAVADGQVDQRRYESYCHLIQDRPEE
jgi:ribosome biogenesis GTPase